MKIESFPRKLFLFRNNLCMFAQTQNELHNMKHMSILAVSLLALVACTPEKKQEADYSQYVNPMIGTDFTGNTYPGAQVPFGMVQLSPDNGLPGWDRISGYFYPDTTIAGFSHTHLSGTGAGDLYDISFMPVTRPYKEAPAPLGIYSTFSHNDEAASAGYYRVLLKDYNINVELTATERCGIQRYTFPEAEASVFLNLKKAMNWDFTLDSKIEVVDSTTIRGYRLSQGWSPLQHVYFETRFSKPFVACHMDTTSIVTKEKGWIGTAYVARFDFNTKKDEEILVTTGISGVSMEGAGKNLRAEAPKDDFDYYQAQASANWNRQLSKIEVKSRNTDDMVKFYTALYHSMIAPTIYSDVDGSYYGPDQQIHKADGWTNYSTFSLWDTYRATHPLLLLTQQERMPAIINSLIRQGEVYGYLPIWGLWGVDNYCMIGNHAVSIIVEAYIKGLRGIDWSRAYEIIKKTLTRDHANSSFFSQVEQYGFYPHDLGYEVASIHLENSYNDWCASIMAKKMGKEKDADFFLKRSMTYRNIYDKQCGFFRPRMSDGSWAEPFDPFRYDGDGDKRYYCEANAWQYLFSVQHDIKGLMQLMNGKEGMEKRLDELFTTVSPTNEINENASGFIGQYAHGNEPSHHNAYLYNYVDKPWKTQRLIRQIISKQYNDSYNGISGNDDMGQTSAWLAFSMMGFYPVNPASGEYALGSPVLDKVIIHLNNGKQFEILIHNQSETNIYVESVSYNGKKLSRPFITHEMIMNGGLLEFYMSENHPH